MPRLLKVPNDPGKRLICSECRNRNNDKNCTGTYLFEQYRTPEGTQSTAAEVFELRGEGSSVEWKVSGPGNRSWQPYLGGTVFCPLCLRQEGVYAVYDARTGEVAEA